MADSVPGLEPFHVMPTALDSDAMRAAWMIEKGCAGQAQLLVSRLK